MTAPEPVGLTRDAAEAAIYAFLREEYGLTDEWFNEGELDLVEDGDGHWQFEFWEGESDKSELFGTGYVHPNGYVEGVYY